MDDNITDDIDLTDIDETELDWAKIGTYVGTAVLAVGAWKGFQWMKERRAAKAVVIEMVPDSTETPEDNEE